jgi:hypothetical protein
MAKLFISYSRSDQVQARLLAADLEDLSHSVWLDAELAGGQLWWEQILKEIRGCEIFVVVMSKASVVDSLACKREFQYAADLQKPILPVLVAEDVSVSLLPAELQKVQFVNYQHRDINSIKALARALQALPLGKELPEPLPTAPEPPISYLASLSHQIDLASFLDLDTQSRIVIELKSSLRDPATALDAQLLLKRLRGRHDLFAKIADDIDQVLLPSRTPRRLIATPQAARVKAVPTPMIAVAERETMATLRPWVQWLLWTTPFTAFVSGQNFRRHWVEKFSYAYFLFGVICVFLALQPLTGMEIYEPAAFFPFAFPFVVISIKRFHSQLVRPAIAIAATLLLAPVIFVAFTGYCYVLQLAALRQGPILWMISIIFFVTGAAKAHWLIMASRQALAQPATSLQGH